MVRGLNYAAVECSLKFFKLIEQKTFLWLKSAKEKQ